MGHSMSNQPKNDGKMDSTFPIFIKLFTLVHLYKRCLNLKSFFNLTSRSPAMDVQTYGLEENCSLSNSFQMSVDSLILKLSSFFDWLHNLLQILEIVTNTFQDS